MLRAKGSFVSALELSDQVAQQLIKDAQYRKDLMSCRQVAKHLGVSIRTLRRWISEGRFPPSIFRSAHGRQEYWLRTDVFAYQQTAIKQRKSQPAVARYKTVDAIEEALERRHARLDLQTQKMLKQQRLMWQLMADDPASFAKKHPNLRNWVKQQCEAMPLIHRKPANKK